jgi:hypothetical protein
MAARTQAEARIEELLERAYPGVTVEQRPRYRLGDFEWSVARCLLTGGPADTPESVVVKWLRDDPNGWRVDHRQMLNERAALEFLDEIGLPIAPRFISSDASTSLIVMEDLHAHRPLYDLLNGPVSTDAARGLTAFADALGRLAAETAGAEGVYVRRRAGLGRPCDLSEFRVDKLAGGWREARAAAASVEVDVAPAADSEMADVLDTLGETGPFRAFSSGDAGENNFLWDGYDGRLIDFEFARFQHALLDGACLYIVHPRWILFPHRIAASLEATYRSALSEGITEAEDDRTWNRVMGAAVMARTLASLGRRILRVGQRPSGDASRAQLITIFEFAARAARQHRVLPALTSLCDELAETLRRRWPDARERLEGLHGREDEWIRR